jgi:predicted Zn-dependent protease with MMP-like domain
MPYPVSKAQFAELVERALGLLPKQFADALEEVRVEIRDRPTRKELKSVGLSPNHLLLGLYVGRPITERPLDAETGRLPDVIYIFQDDVQEVAETEADLVEQVRITVLHELGHHFGMDEDDLEELGYG